MGTKLTKKEKGIVLAAANAVSEGEGRYCCSAIRRQAYASFPSYYNGFNTAYEIISKFSRFYGKRIDLPWLPVEETDTRVLLLLTFAEVG